MIEEWKGFIQKRTNGSERVNYDDPNFPSYVYRGYVCCRSTLVRIITMMWSF